MQDGPEVIKRWGEWALLSEDGEELLQHKCGYRVDFRNMQRAAGMLDIIFQVERKKLSAEAVGQMITALADMFDPQSTLCCDGFEHPFDPREKLMESIHEGFIRSANRDL